MYLVKVPLSRSLPNLYSVKCASWNYTGIKKYLTTFRRSERRSKLLCERHHLSQFHDVFSSHMETTSRSMVLLAPARWLSIYVVRYQDSTPVDQNLLVAKSRVAPKEMSIPRLDLVAAHTLAELQNNVSKALASLPITAYHNWADKTANRGEWSTFVRSRVKKIGELTETTWSYVPPNENPSDFGTRGTESSKIKALWLKGPSWLSDESNRPLQPRSWKLMKLNPRETGKK